MIIFFFGYKRNSHPGCSVKKGVLKHFANFAAKDLCWSLFLIKLEAWNRRANSDGGGGRSPLSFLKNRKKLSWFCKKHCPSFRKRALFVCIYRLNSYLKCSFKSILEKKHKNVLLRHVFLYVLHETFIKVSLFQETSPAQKNVRLHACERLQLY